MITETQKTISRVHDIPLAILHALETQHTVSTTAAEKGAKRLIILKKDEVRMVRTPAFGGFNTTVGPKMGAGFTIGVVVERHGMSKPGETLLDSRVQTDTGHGGNGSGSAGVWLNVSERGGLLLSLSDSSGATVVLETDPVCTAALNTSCEGVHMCVEKRHYGTSCVTVWRSTCFSYGLL